MLTSSGYRLLVLYRTPREAPTEHAEQFQRFIEAGYVRAASSTLETISGVGPMLRASSWIVSGPGEHALQQFEDRINAERSEKAGKKRERKVDRIVTIIASVLSAVIGAVIGFLLGRFS